MKRAGIIIILLVFTSGLYAQRFYSGARNISFQDTQRANRQVEAQIFFPADSTGHIGQGEFPLLIFAPAEGTSFTEYDYLWYNLIGNGYVLVFPVIEPGVAMDVDAIAADILAIVSWMRTDLSPDAVFFQESLGENLGLMGHGLGGSAAILAAAAQPAGLRSLITFSAIKSDTSIIEAARKLQVPYLGIGTDMPCYASASEHQLPILEATGSSYRAWFQIKRGTFCQFGRAFEGTPCRDRESASCPQLNTVVTRAQQQSLALIASFPWMEFLLRAKCEQWDYFYNFARNPATHVFQEWGEQPSPRADFRLEHTGSVIWLENHSRSALHNLWDFGDGKTTVDRNPVHIYQRVDSYQVKLTVATYNGCADSIQKTVEGLSAVALLGFRARSEENAIVLDWATATESQNANFVIERSINGIDFHEYDRVGGEISSFARKDYLFKDPSLPSGIYFYRLRQETTYGKVSYSDIVQVKHRLSISLAITDFTIALQEGELGIGFHCENAGETALRLISLSGQTLFHQKIEAIAGRNTSSMHIQGFLSGIYVLAATQNNETAHRVIFIR